MKRINKYIILVVFAAAALSLMPFDSRAYGEREGRKSGTDSFGELTSQIGVWAEQSSRYSLDMLGITGMECNYTFISGDDEQLWLFQAEPEIRGVDRDGPSHGKLEDGDVIVAIDGMLITTRKAGIRFANLVAGEPVELDIRRRGRTRSVTIVPRAAPKPEVPIDLTVHRDDRSNTITIEPRAQAVPELARSIEELARSAAEIGEAIETMGLPDHPGIPAFPEFNIDFAGKFPRGWIGFGLSFGGSIRKKDPDEPAEWRFDEPPSIISVQPGSPADEAGLQVNDVLLEIDGIKLDSGKGGKRFSRMEPGQIVEWKVLRGGRTFTTKTRADHRPERERIEAPPERIESPPERIEAPPEPPGQDALRPLRFTGTLGGTEIEVRGGTSVRVEVNEETGEIVIRSDDSVVRLKSKDKH
ncbi:MAG: PDZ domain-containing protein [Candidatus Hydrogenedentota bacterium]|nr:MAG: PDZ domain-containing protein [Candidatus Hydrogenedentota bacterium]